MVYDFIEQFPKEFKFNHTIFFSITDSTAKIKSCKNLIFCFYIKFLFELALCHFGMRI